VGRENVRMPLMSYLNGGMWTVKAVCGEGRNGDINPFIPRPHSSYITFRVYISHREVIKISAETVGYRRECSYIYGIRVKYKYKGYERE
jgi:hypothetical protein